MKTATWRYRDVTAGTALALAGLIAATPITAVAPQVSGTVVAARAVRLVVDGESILNVPFNLFQDIVNIPSNEVAAISTLASSLLFPGNAWTPSATNIWGEDPGDPGHFMALVDLLIPFKEISGLGSPEIDPVADAAGTAGLGQQLALLTAAMLPVSASCDATSCPPTVPLEPITGITQFDRTLWLLHAAADPQSFALLNGWSKVSLQDLLNGYTFPADAADPSAGVGPGGSVLGDDVFFLPGTHPGPDGANLMPWAGLDFKFNPLGPFENFANSLLQQPDLNGFDFVGPADLGRSLQAVLAGLVMAFNLFVPGSPVCPASCGIVDELHLTTRDLVQAVGNAWPGNPLVDHWLELDADGLANGQTADQVQAMVAGLQVGMFTLDPTTTREIDDFLATINPQLPYIATHNGTLTDPAFAGWNGELPVPTPEYGGVDPSALWYDYLTVLDPSGGLTDSLTQSYDQITGLWDGLFGSP